MKDEPRSPLKHEHVHAVPTVIHHPEEDLPLLARWIQQAMQSQTRFWSLLIGFIAVVVGLAVLGSGFSSGRNASDEAWNELETAKTAEERVDIAKKYPKSAAESWALLQAANEFYSNGFADLPANRDAAAPQLKKALEYFQQVAKTAPKTAPQTRAAAFGVARTHEARNELEKAIEQYELVAKTWPDSDEGRESKQLAKALRKPENVAFYQELYTYKPVEVSLPAEGQSTIPLPPGHPTLGSDSPLLLPPPPPSPTAEGAAKETGTEKASQAPVTALPDDVFAKPETKPATAPESKPATTPETKKDEPKP